MECIVARSPMRSLPQCRRAARAGLGSGGPLRVSRAGISVDTRLVKFTVELSRSTKPDPGSVRRPAPTRTIQITFGGTSTMTRLCRDIARLGALLLPLLMLGCGVDPRAGH